MHEMLLIRDIMMKLEEEVGDYILKHSVSLLPINGEVKEVEVSC